MSRRSSTAPSGGNSEDIGGSALLHPSKNQQSAAIANKDHKKKYKTAAA
jgi:hypothetical protein